VLRCLIGPVVYLHDHTNRLDNIIRTLLISKVCQSKDTAESLVYLADKGNKLTEENEYKEETQKSGCCLQLSADVPDECMGDRLGSRWTYGGRNGGHPLGLEQRHDQISGHVQVTSAVNAKEFTMGVNLFSFAARSSGSSSTTCART
jgi:hypothetical protein